MFTSELQSRVTEKGEGQVGLSSHARKARVERWPQRGEARRTDIGQLASLDVAPELLDWIQVRRIAGQPLHREPRALPGHVGGHHTARMAAQAVPNEQHALLGEVALEVAQKRNEGSVRVAARARLEEEAGPTAVPAKRQGPGDRQPLPIPTGVDQDRRFAARGPRTADDRLLRDAAFVFEDEPGVLAPGVFFSRAQRRVFHGSIAASSRSRARRAGRWSDQFNPRRIRHTCPG